MLNNVFDELLELIENRLVVIIIKDFIPLCFFGKTVNWTGLGVHFDRNTSTKARGGARKNSWGLSGLELPSKICELKCSKPKLLNLVSNYKHNVFQM